MTNAPPGVGGRWVGLIRLLAWMGLVLAALFFLTTGGTYPGIASVDGHVIGQVLAIVVLGGWLAIALVRPHWRPQTPLLLPIAIACAAYLASALVSQRPRLSLEPTLAGLGWALAYLFLARLLAQDWFRERVAVLMTAFVAVVAIGYLVQVVVEWVTWWGLVGRLAIPPLRPSFAGLFLGSPNLIGTALLLLAPLVIAIAWTRYRRHGVAITLALASGLAILLSGSRGAWLGVGVAAILAIVRAVSRPGARLSPAALPAAARARPILLVPVVVAGAVGLVLAPSLLQRFAQGGGTLRLDLWRSALAIFADHPILGAGPGTWVQLKVEANPAGVANLILPHAHDMYVQAAAELGIVGLVAGAILVLAVLRRLWVGRRSTESEASGGRSTLSLESGAVLVSLAAFAAQSVVDNLSNLPFVILIVISLVAWVDGGMARDARGAAPREARLTSRRLDRLQRAPLVPVLGLLALALVSPTLLRVDQAAAQALAGNGAALRGQWPVALDSYEAARAMDPSFTLYEVQTAGALARVGRTAEARELLAKAIEFDPVAINVIGLAALEAQLGDREAALAHVRQAISLGPGEPMIALNAGLIAERIGDADLALEAFAYAIAIDPPLIQSGIWLSPPRIATKQEISDRARALTDDFEAALILAYAGQPTDAQLELERLPPSSRREVYIAATEWLAHDPASALARIDRMLQQDPGDWFAAAWAARIGRFSQSANAQNRYSKWALIVQADAAPQVIGQLSAVPAGFDTPSANLPGNYPWAVYRRPVSPHLMMPQLVSIGVE